MGLRGPLKARRAAFTGSIGLMRSIDGNGPLKKRDAPVEDAEYKEMDVIRMGGQLSMEISVKMRRISGGGGDEKRLVVEETHTEAHRITHPPPSTAHIPLSAYGKSFPPWDRVDREDTLPLLRSNTLPPWVPQQGVIASRPAWRPHTNSVVDTRHPVPSPTCTLDVYASRKRVSEGSVRGNDRVAVIGVVDENDETSTHTSTHVAEIVV